MKASTYLNKVKYLDDLIQDKVSELDQLRYLASGLKGQGDGQPGTKSSDPLGDAICRIIEAEADINRQINKFVTFKAEVAYNLGKLPPEENTLLHRIYIGLQGDNGTTYQTIKEASKSLGKGYTWGKNTYKSAMKHLQEIIN